MGRGRAALRIASLTLATSLALVACASEATPVASVATFQVADGSQFKVLITDPGLLKTVTALADGEDVPSIPNGKIVHETGVNTGWSWSLDPTDFRFEDITDASCQGDPEELEAGTFTSDRFCPWSAIVVALEPAT